MHQADKGKPYENMGRKATGLRQKAMTAGLPEFVQFLSQTAFMSLEAVFCGLAFASPLAGDDHVV